MNVVIGSNIMIEGAITIAIMIEGTITIDIMIEDTIAIAISVGKGLRINALSLSGRSELKVLSNNHISAVLNMIHEMTTTVLGSIKITLSA